MTPEKVILEIVKETIQLKVIAKDTLKGYSIIESSPFKTGQSLPHFRKEATKYAKQFQIPFEDKTN